MKGQDQLFSRASDEWATPLDLYARLDAAFGFTLDPCAMPENRLGALFFYTQADDGLSRSWEGHTVFVNPPYSATAAWVAKCATERAQSVVLIPARTDTRYFHDWVFPYASSLLFIKGRLKFGGASAGAPFPSVLVGYGLDLTVLEGLGRGVKL